MKMIFHQHVSMNGDLELACSIVQPAQKSLKIAAVAKNRLPVMALLKNVVRLLGNDESGKSGHSLRRNVKVHEGVHFNKDATQTLFKFGIAAFQYENSWIAQSMAIHESQ